MYENMRISRRNFMLGAMALTANMGIGSVRAQEVWWVFRLAEPLIPLHGFMPMQ